MQISSSSFSEVSLEIRYQICFLLISLTFDKLAPTAEVVSMWEKTTVEASLAACLHS